MVDCKPVLMSVDTQAKVSTESGPPIADPTHFRSLTGTLQYLTFTRPNIAYAIQHIYLHVHDPWETHLTTMKCPLCYLRSTLDYDFLLRRSTSSELTVYTDTDWVGYPNTRWSNSGYAVFLDANLVSWSSKHQNVVSRSSDEAKYQAAANGMAEASWLRQLLQEIHALLMKSTLIYCDNISIVYLYINLIQQQRTKHVKIDLHIVRECVTISYVCVLHVLTTS
jgi:hypothetical protein